MDRSFQSLLLTGKYVIDDRNFPTDTTSDQTHIPTAMSYDKSLLPYASSYDTFNENIQSAKTSESSTEYSTSMEFKRLKTAPSPELFNLNNIPTFMFNQLPDLRSIEPLKYSPVETTPFNHHTQQPTLTNYFTPIPPQQPPFPPPPPPAKLSGTELAYKRRRTLSDKTRSLQKLLPVDKKMDMATIYEETYKYIMFLKAQISVLESMPVVSSSSSSSSCLNLRSGNPRYGGLGKLNRQQVLEVMVNSPVSQSLLYSRGCCVYSLEQLVLFKEVAEKRFLF